MRIAVVGATGLVGRKMLDLLIERNFPVSELIPIASERSKGQTVNFKGKDYTVITAQDALSMQPQIALFSAGGTTSLEWAPKFAEIGCFVIDNSSAWRMTEGVPLVVPEINPDSITKETKIIANPNCSTIQLVVALNPLHKAFGLNRIIVSTYQSVTGTGKAAVDQLEQEKQGSTDLTVYPHSIHENCLPHCDVFLDNAYTKEEMKLVNEPRKIMNLPELHVTATAVRVPVMGGHSESVYAEFNSEVTAQDVKRVLSLEQGIVLQDEPSQNTYPMPINAHEKDEVFIGRIRNDLSSKKAINMFVVADNLRKGAATNAIQIAEYLIKQPFFTK